MTPLKTLILTTTLTTLLLTCTLINAQDLIPTTANPTTTQPTTKISGEGRYTYTNGTALGHYNAFTIDPTTATITNYTIHYTPTLTINSTPLPKPDTNNNGTTPQEHSSGPTLEQNPNPTTPQQQTPQKNTNGTIPQQNPDHPDQHDNTTIPQEAPYSNENQQPNTLMTIIYPRITLTDFKPIGAPIPYANFLTIQGTTVLMMFYDQDDGAFNYYTGAATLHLTFTLPTTATLIPHINGKNQHPNDSPLSPTWQTAEFTTNQIVTTLSVTDGNITTTTNTIAVTLNPYGTLRSTSRLLYPLPDAINNYWYGDLHLQEHKTQIENAKAEGTITAEGWCTGTVTYTTPLNTTNNSENTILLGQDPAPTCYTFTDPTFTMTFNTINQHTVDVIVNSENSTGRIVIVNLQRSLFNATSLSTLLITIDNTGITSVSTLEDLLTKVDGMNSTGAYYALMGENLVSVFIYIPHFSTHTISIQSMTTPLPLVSSGLVPIALSVAFLAAILVGLVLQRRKPYE